MVRQGMPQIVVDQYMEEGASYQRSSHMVSGDDTELTAALCSLALTTLAGAGGR